MIARLFLAPLDQLAQRGFDGRIRIMGKDNAPAGLIQFFRIDALFNAKVFAAALVVAKFEFVNIFNRAFAAD